MKIIRLAETPGQKRAKSARARAAVRSGLEGMLSLVLVLAARSWKKITTNSKRLGMLVLVRLVGTR